MVRFRSMEIGNPDDLQSIDVNFLVAKDSDTRRGNRLQILAVIAELFVISSDEKCALRRRRELLQGLRRLASINGRTVKQIAGYEDGSRFFFQNSSDDPA